MQTSDEEDALHWLRLIDEASGGGSCVIPEGLQTPRGLRCTPEGCKLPELIDAGDCYYQHSGGRLRIKTCPVCKREFLAHWHRKCCSNECRERDRRPGLSEYLKNRRASARQWRLKNLVARVLDL